MWKRRDVDTSSGLSTVHDCERPELSMSWVGLDWVETSVFGGLGWVHYSKSTKNVRIMLMH